MRTLSNRLAVPLLLVLLLGCCHASGSTNETAARQWFEQFNLDLAVQRNLAVEAGWNYAVNITDENSRKRVEAELKLTEFLKLKRTEMQQFAWRNFTDKNLTRLFSKSDDIGTSVANATMQELYSSVRTRLATFYNTAKVKDPRSGDMVPLEPNIVAAMADPDVPQSVKRDFWVGWRDESGKKMKNDYEEFVHLGNAMIREAGYANLAEYWQSWYEPTSDFEQTMETLWTEFKPYYSLLHAYVRSKLRPHFGSEIFPLTNHLPAHILGNMWAQSWANVDHLTMPYPESWTVDITKEMLRKGWNSTTMFRVSEEFFASLGLGNMTDTFWAKTVMDRLPNVEMNCHASAWDFYTNEGDFRVKQCTSVTLPYLATTHHEMGHIQYFMQYEKQPVPFRDGANPGFHEAVGDTIELAVMTPEHLVKIGLLNSTIDSNEYYVNYMFLMALKKLAFIPFGYLIDKWRWSVFKGEVTPQQYNSAWWKLRCDLQGISSPVPRSEDDFDPGAKYHVPGNTPYIRYFVSHFLQFQFYEALCNKSGHTGPLYKCDFYQSKEAGDALKKMLAAGSSKHWEDTLEELTGTREVSAAPLIRYFRPLFDFLTEANKNSSEPLTWSSECPGDDWYTSTAAPPVTTAPPPQTTTSGSSGRLAGATWLQLSMAALLGALLSTLLTR
ncbi:hypothetical protein BOX15_Mlig016804g1 [Macrostomum lignano]|uniref:Angiotensin-converting enzyme n=1 Tax=Macrostomum lignano TaxID=282301 RepID=A0A267F365_9PLAT|nr:hypothetical protein BOX15_Mlig016804g1 [Macrostomum lignano]